MNHDSDDSMRPIFDAMKVASAERRELNRESGAAKLTEAGIPFITNNRGVHLQITHNGVRVDYWPGTGLWRVPSTNHSRRGIKSLLDFLGVKQ